MKKMTMAYQLAAGSGIMAVAAMKYQCWRIMRNGGGGVIGGGKAARRNAKWSNSSAGISVWRKYQ